MHNLVQIASLPAQKMFPPWVTTLSPIKTIHSPFTPAPLFIDIVDDVGISFTQVSTWISLTKWSILANANIRTKHADHPLSYHRDYLHLWFILTYDRVGVFILDMISLRVNNALPRRSGDGGGRQWVVACDVDGVVVCCHLCRCGWCKFSKMTWLWLLYHGWIDECQDQLKQSRRDKCATLRGCWLRDLCRRVRKRWTCNWCDDLSRCMSLVRASEFWFWGGSDLVDYLLHPKIEEQVVTLLYGCYTLQLLVMWDPREVSS